MTIALCCDYLLERDHYLETLEFLAQDERDLHLYTFAHQKLLSPLMHHPIFSTGLSQVVKTPREFYQKSYLLPGLAAALAPQSEYQQVIYCSRGFAQLLLPQTQAPQTHYLYSWEGPARPRSWRERLFRPWLKRCQRRALPATSLFKSPLSSLADLPGEKLAPPFSLDEFPLLPATGLSWDYYLAHLGELESSARERFIACFVAHQTPLYLLEEGESRPWVTYLGEKCAGELPGYLNHCRALFDLTGQEFPALALQALASGRPVVTSNPSLTSTNAGPGIIPYQGLSQLPTHIRTLDRDYPHFPRPQLRSQALAWRQHPTAFKRRIKSHKNNELLTL